MEMKLGTDFYNIMDYETMRTFMMRLESWLTVEFVLSLNLIILFFNYLIIIF